MVTAAVAIGLSGSSSFTRRATISASGYLAALNSSLYCFISWTTFFCLTCSALLVLAISLFTWRDRSSKRLLASSDWAFSSWNCWRRESIGRRSNESWPGSSCSSESRIR